MYLGLFTDSGEVSGKGYYRLGVGFVFNRDGPSEDPSAAYWYNAHEILLDQILSDWGTVTQVRLYESRFDRRENYTYLYDTAPIDLFSGTRATIRVGSFRITEEAIVRLDIGLLPYNARVHPNIPYYEHHYHAVQIP